MSSSNPRINNISKTVTVFPETVEDVKLRLEKPAEKKENDEPAAQLNTPRAEEILISQSSSSSTQIESPSGSTPDRSLRRSPLLSLKLSTTTPNRDHANVNEREDFIEVWEENEAGLSWGHKKARDETWEEKWLQQKSKRLEAADEPGSAEQVSVVFGQSSGINGRLHQRWTAAWETQTTPCRHGSGVQLVNRNVKKSVCQYDEDMETVIEEWDEQIVEISRPLSEALESADHWTRHFCVIKAGSDKNTGRKWREIREERFRQCVEGEQLMDLVESFEEIAGDATKSRYYRKEVDGSERTEVRMSTVDNCRPVVVNDEWCRNAEGMKWGKKSGITADNDEWHSTWFERPDGDREVVEWKRTSGCVRGKKSGWSHNGETYDERWEKTENQLGNDVVQLHDFVDKWWSGANGHRWGEKSLTLEKKVDGEELKEGQILGTSVIREKWYDNTTEKSVDNWKVDKEFEKKEEGETRLVRLVEHGYQIGDRYSDGTEWGEHWGRVYEPGQWDEQAIIKTKIDGPHCEESRESIELELRIRHHDRWWKEPSGNKWGEKRYADLKQNEERNENWYNNGVEEQVDRWEILENGSRHGEKFGRAVDGSREWKEKWSGRTNEDFWIDKYWTEQQEGPRMLRWGEMEGKEGEKQWKQKWVEDKNANTNTGHKWVEKWDDDGFGNIQTIKEGEDWVEGRTVNWFSDKYGECLSKREKWAVKQGTNGDGNTWIEKWNELPDENRAEKSGKNTSGDEWREVWKEHMEEGKKIKWAEKTGKNPQGEEWFETWFEEGDDKKKAKKIGKNRFEEWTEEWGESMEDGKGEKWTAKWARNFHSGDSHGQSWGDRWDSTGGHHWGEKWTNDQVEKWWRDNPGRPEGC